jgi:ABC-type cobalt transport system substrate-binding protein
MTDQSADPTPTDVAQEKQIEELQKAARINSRLPDTQAFLAFSIIYGVFGLIVLVIFKPPPQEIASTVFTLIGTVITFGAVVAGYYFGSSKGSDIKTVHADATMNALVNKVVGTNGDLGTGGGGASAVSAARAAAPAAAEAAAPAAAAVAAPPAAAVAAPPAAEVAVEHALAERDLEHKPGESL